MLGNEKTERAAESRVQATVAQASPRVTAGKLPDFRELRVAKRTSHPRHSAGVRILGIYGFLFVPTIAQQETQ